MQRRAAQVTETRRRIIEATVELHRTIGPAATEVAEVARRAGVQRVTVYAHFPDQASLLAACSAHWRSLHPAPDPERWRAIVAPDERLRHGLHAMYGWFRETEPMTSNVLRDAELVDALRSIVAAGLGAWLDRSRVVLAEPWTNDGAPAPRVAAAVRIVTDVHAWHALAVIGDEAAADIATAMVLGAARPPS